MKKYLLNNGKRCISFLLVALMMFSMVSTGVAETYSREDVSVLSEADIIKEDSSAVSDISEGSEEEMESEAESEAESSQEVSEDALENEPGSIKGSLWLDSNTNGIWDEEEYGIPGLTVALYEEGEKVAEALTESDGSYIFEDLQAGDYTVGVMAQTVNEEEYLIPMKSLQSGGDNKFDANWDTDPVVSESELIVLGDGDEIEGIDAGMRGKVQVVPAASTTVTTLAALKTAISNAASGDTIYINANITLTECLKIPAGKSLTIKSLSASTIRTLTRSSAGCSLENRSSSYGGRHFYVDGKLTLENINIYGLGYTYGADVYNGGIYVTDKGSLDIKTGTTISKCYNYMGGAIYSYNNVTVNGAVVKNNYSVFGGGGIYNRSLNFDNSTSLTMNSGEISNNEVSNSLYNYNSANGGGIEAFYSNVYIYGGSISNNTALDGGGGIEWCGAELTISGAVISGNKSQSGGGVHMTFENQRVDTPVNITNATISNNTASGWGGGIDISTSSLTGTVTITGSELSGNYSEYGGGAIQAGRSRNKLVISNTTITNNSTRGNGGAIHTFNFNADEQTYTNPVDTKYYSHINIASSVTFSGNSSYYGASIPPTNKSSFNSRFNGDLLNNNNINYNPRKYTVSYYANSGSGAPEPQTKQMGTPLVLSTVEPTRSGYTFLGWSTSITATAATYQPGGTFNIDETTSLYAVWQASTYTVSYNANGGTGAPSSQSKKHDVNLTLSTTKPTRSGYTFLGWSASSTAQVASYAPGASYKANESMVLYAVWSANSYTISYDANGGTGAPTSQTKKHDTELKLSTTKPTRTGYTFLGWSTSKTATTATYASGASYTSNVSAVLYAVWKINTYTVSYSANGGTGAPAAQTKTYGVNLTLSATKPTRTGYIFLGWTNSSESQTVRYNAGAAYTTNASITLYAVWEINKYTISYNANGGSYPPSSQTKTYGEDLILAKGIPSRSNYLFLGWSTSSTATTATYQPGGKFTLNQNTTLYAVWRLRASYTITYNANGGTGAPASQTKHEGVEIFLSQDIPVRSGHTLLGWATSSTATKAEYVPGQVYADDKSVTLYAIWTANVVIYYDPNQGTGGPVSEEFYPGDGMISGLIPTRDGYNFLGWAFDPYASSINYRPGQGYYGYESITLYAVWENSAYIIKYNANGGTDAPYNQNKFHDYDLVLSTTIPKRTGFDFLGWSESSTAVNPTYLAGGVFREDRSTTLYAVWQTTNYLIEYDANGGEGAPGDQLKPHGAFMYLRSEIPQREGYNFLGWATSKTATTVEYPAGSFYYNDESIKLYAVWEKKSYTIRYYANGGSGAPAGATKVHGVSLTLSSTKPTREGHTFLGWSESDVAVTATYSAGAQFTADANTNLYAVWSANTYTIYYNANGGTGAPSSQTKTYNVDTFLSTTEPTRTGHTFLGWATSNSAKVAEYGAGGVYTNNAGVTLYAVWEANVYFIIYDGNGGVNPPAGQTKTHGVTLTLSTDKPTRDGYSFLGWSTSKTATTATYTAGGTFTVNADTVLYAVWKADTYVVSYNANGGTNPPSSQTKTHDVTLTLTTSKPTREGYNFLGWSRSRTSVLADYASGGSFALNADTVLYAVWEINTYTVSYNANGGTNAPSSQTKTYDVDLTLTTDEPTKENYTFLGWSSSSTATTATYEAGGLYTANASATLYAVWELNTYTIKYDANGGTGAPGDQTKTHDVPRSLSTVKPTRAGYTFLGWSESSTATTATYAAGGSYTANASVTLYAVWKLNTYTVSYNANGGIGAPTSQTKTHDVALTLRTDKPTREGYTFLGWSASSTETTATYAAGASYTDNASVTLYAVWKLNVYTIKYDANGGTGAPGDQTKTHDVPRNLSTVKPTRTGYTFLGWSESKTATTAAYTAGASYTENSSVTLYAVWKLNTYTVSYDANGGTGAPASQTKTHGVELTLTTGKPTRSNYSFLGWATSKTATAVEYNSGEAFNIDANTTLYAVWKADTYYVMYDANGGTDAPRTQVKSHDIPLTLTAEEPTWEGHSFLGWSTSSTATTATYAPGGTFTVNAHTTLYAVWETDTYTISYNANGGTNAPASQTKTHDVALALTTSKPVKEGYTFLGWSASSTATTATYAAGGSYTANASVTLYAVWEINTYRIKYEANGGTGAPGDQTKTHDVTLNLSTVKPKREGYTFLGWSASSTATTATYAAGGSYTANAPITLYAVWKLNTYTVSYSANGGTNAPKSQTKTHDVELTLTTDKPTRTGYTFLGWSASSAATTPTYTAGDSYIANAPIVLFAVWEINTYTVSYSGNGGINAPKSQTKTHDVELTLATDKPTRTGYTFLGWSASSAATTATYTAGDSYTENASIVLFAVWEINTYTVSYNANGGTGAPANQTKTHDVALTLTTDEPARDGYSFLGWSELSTAATATYTAGGTFTANADTTLYAVWKADTYTVSYNANGGTGAPASQTKTHDVALTLATDEPAREGYSFLGWSESSTAATATYTAGGTFTGNADTTLYAVWEADTYTVSYNANGGTNAPANQAKVHDKVLTLTEEEPEREGYIFLGWSEDDSAAEPTYLPGGSYSSNEGAELYAVWMLDSDSFIATTENIILYGHWAGEQTGEAVFWISFNSKAISAEEFAKIDFEHRNALLWKDETKKFHSISEASLTGNTKTENGKVWSEVKVPVEVHYSGVSEIVAKSGSNTLATSYVITPGNNASEYGVLDSADATEVIRVINKKSEVPGAGLGNNFIFEMMDMNGDGIINSSDAADIIRLINGKQFFHKD